MKLNVVLFCPSNEKDVGNITRTCAAADFKLHLIKPFGFDINEKELIRCSANHIDEASLEVYDNLDEFLMKNDGKFYYLSKKSKKSPAGINYKNNEDIYLMFGFELDEVNENCFNFPRVYGTELNFSNMVAVAVYEVLRQLDYPGLSRVEPDNFKGEDFLLNFDGK